MKKTAKYLAIVLAFVMIFALTACNKSPSPSGSETPSAPVVQHDANIPLVVATSDLSEKFSPFFYTTGYDGAIADYTQLSLMSIDRMGGIIYNGIAGETVSYNGTDYYYNGIADLGVDYDKEADVTTYSAKLREDIFFSDGVQMTADDIIFNYYVLLDTDFDGLSSLRSQDIIGLQEYRSQIPSDAIETFATIIKAIIAAGPDYTATSDDTFTQEMYDKYVEVMNETWRAGCQAIVDYVVKSYAGTAYAASHIGSTEEAIKADANLAIAFGMSMWQFASYKDGKLTTADGKVFDIAGGQYPTIDDMFETTYAMYNGDPKAFWDVENEGSYDGPYTLTLNALVQTFGASAGVKSIEGITKTGPFSVEVKVKGFAANAVYQILGISVAPMHYYGDKALYDYENGQYGFPRGDLSIVRSKTTSPMGAGPYKYVKYENRIAYLEANENYFEGAPKTKYIQYKETDTTEVATGLVAGTVDAGELTGTIEIFNQIRGYNTNGELTGDVVTTYRVDNLGYGYIGLNASNILVGDRPGSAESKNLRKALATIISVYRDVAYNSYYGDAATTIQYPVSNTSWAAPQATDEGYQVAFSKDVDGNPIYTASMSETEKYAAARTAALGFFAAAGFTVENGKVTKGPGDKRDNGNSYLVYEAIVPAEGKGAHPSFAILTEAKASFAEIGITLEIVDPADSNFLWNTLDAQSHEIWCAAWSSTIDPDMYQVYHSSNSAGQGTKSNRYNLTSSKLDKLIMDARNSDDQSYRRSLYLQALDEIMDWAVEIPGYQRQNCRIVSTKRVDAATITPDVTTYWGYLADVINLQMIAQ